jgi:hypothetical protein
MLTLFSSDNLKKEITKYVKMQMQRRRLSRGAIFGQNPDFKFISSICNLPFKTCFFKNAI